MIEIAQPKLTMDTNGAVCVRQRDLEDKCLLAGYFIVRGRIFIRLQEDARAGND